MKEFVYVMEDPQGNHARPAGKVVAAAKEFNSLTTLWLNGQSYDLKKLLVFMGAPIKQGDEVVIRCEGDDEAAASEALEKAFKEAFKA